MRSNKHLTQLGRRVDVEFATGQLVDLCRESAEALLHLGAHGAKEVGVHAHADALHIGEKRSEGQLDIAVGVGETLGGEAVEQEWA